MKVWGRMMSKAFSRRGRIAALAATLITATAGVMGLAAAQAAGDARTPEHHHWHFAGPFGTFDRAALQRGYQIYREVCSSCHGMQYLHFRNLGEPGGPYYDEEHPNANDNPVVRAIAADTTVAGEPDDFGDPTTRPATPADAFPNPFATEGMARLANGGALPPDLSVIVSARHHGADYIRSLLIGYEEPPEDVTIRPGLYYNPYFPGGAIAMAPPLPEERVTYADDTEATTEQMANDVVEFLVWAADPHQEARKRMGFMVLIYLTLLALLFWISYKVVWRNVAH